MRVETNFSLPLSRSFARSTLEKLDRRCLKDKFMVNMELEASASKVLQRHAALSIPSRFLEEEKGEREERRSKYPKVLSFYSTPTVESVRSISHSLSFFLSYMNGEAWSEKRGRIKFQSLPRRQISSQKTTIFYGRTHPSLRSFSIESFLSLSFATMPIPRKTERIEKNSRLVSIFFRWHAKALKVKFPRLVEG